MQIRVMVFPCKTFLFLFIHGAPSYQFTKVFEHLFIKNNICEVHLFRFGIGYLQLSAGHLDCKY